MTATKTCLFCGRVLPPKRVKSGGKSDEHIIARWLLEHLGIGVKLLLDGTGSTSPEAPTPPLRALL